MIDLTKEIWFYDDTSEDKRILKAISILWSDNRYALFKVDREEKPFLIDIQYHVVENMKFWLATNKISRLIKKLKERRAELEQEIDEEIIDAIVEAREWNREIARRRLAIVNAEIARHC